MKPFRFLTETIVITHDGYSITYGETFYTMNKEERKVRHWSGLMKTIPKHTIVERKIDRKTMSNFKPDYDALLYFKYKENANRYAIQHFDFDALLIELASTIR